VQETKQRSRFVLEPAVTRKANYSLAPVNQGLSRFTELTLTLKVTAAERDSGNETYDVYITTENRAGETWDLVHFPQVAATGAKTFVARLRSDLLAQQVTTAVPGVASNESATLRTETGGANQGTKTLGAGVVRHGPWGDKIGYELVVAGTLATGIGYSIHGEAR